MPKEKKSVFLVCQQLTPSVKLYDDYGVTKQAYCEICRYVIILRSCFNMKFIIKSHNHTLEIPYILYMHVNGSHFCNHCSNFYDILVAALINLYTMNILYILTCM